MNAHDESKATVQAMVQQGKGVLAADESAPTFAKRFKAIALEYPRRTSAPIAV